MEWIQSNKIVEIADANEEKYIRELLDSSCQGVKRLFVLAYDNTAGNNQVSFDSYQKYFLPRVKIKNCNIEIDGRNYDYWDYYDYCDYYYDYYDYY